jgi:hypothetical protein
MRVDGRDITVTGSLLQPLTRRTNDIFRVVLSGVFLAVVITSSLITRNEWVALERSISEIVAVLTPTQANLVYLAYGVAILALPFVILVSLIVGRQWKLLGAYAAAAAIAGLALSITNAGIAAPQWHFDLRGRLDTVPSQFVDDPRWIAMLAAVLTVSGPWLPARWRRWWWALLLAFVPIHLVISAVVPARSLFGLAVGWFIGALVVLVVGTPGLDVPLEGAVRAMARRGCVVTALKVVRPSGAGPLILHAECEHQQTTAVMEMYGPHQRGGGVLLQVWRKVRFRDRETAPLHASMRRAVEHRALMAIAIGQLKLANIATIAVAGLERSWTLYAHTPAHGTPLGDCTAAIPVDRVWESLRELHDCQISHGDLRASEITVEETVLFGGFDSAEYGATDAQLRSDIAQLLVTTTHLYDAPSAVRAAIDAFGKASMTSTRYSGASVGKTARKLVKSADFEYRPPTTFSAVPVLPPTRYPGVSARLAVPLSTFSRMSLSMDALVCSLSTRGLICLASSRVRGRKVGCTPIPPLNSGREAVAICSGVTDRPCPNAMVMVFSFCQCAGTIGVAVSPISVGTRRVSPSLVRNAR